ncbi:MAG: hypothetical protein P1P88_19015 [Bacteroidales bacterium]|nr:hypothetical protein [Bacteroidales bacterium]
MIISQPAINTAIQKGEKFLCKNLLPWGEIPIFKIVKGIEHSYTFMPIATAYYLNSCQNLLAENTQYGNFFQKNWMPKNSANIIRNSHPEIDTHIKLLYIYYYQIISKSEHSQHRLEIDLSELETEVKFIDDIAVEMNLIELQSIVDAEKFNRNIKKLNYDKFLRSRSLFYNSKYFHYYQFAKMFTKKRNLDTDEWYIKTSAQDFESILDMVFFTYFLLIVNSASKDICKNIEMILSNQSKDGDWPADSFFINCFGSKALTTAFCVELLKEYMK